MIQNILALIIVFLAAAYTLYSIVKSLTVKQTSTCGGCTGCALKNNPAIKHTPVNKVNFRHYKGMLKA